jgi:hypothetical protein
MYQTNFQFSIFFFFSILLLSNFVVLIANTYFHKKWKYQILSTLFALAIAFYTIIDKNYYSNLSLLPGFNSLDVVYIILIAGILSLVEEYIYSKLNNNEILTK